MRITHATRSVSLCAIAFALSTTTAFADEAPDQSRIIVTASALAQEAAARVERTPGGVDVVAADDFENKLAVSLRDALTFSPGVYTQPRFGQEVRISIRGSGLSRGFHMRGLTLLQDGIPINLADDNGDFQEFDPQVFQHLEVYRGGNALRLGGSTLGGAINAVTPTGRSAPGVNCASMAAASTRSAPRPPMAMPMTGAMPSPRSPAIGRMATAIMASGNPIASTAMSA